jgi:hypothetical protein
MKNNFLNTFTLFLKQLKVPVTESSALEYLETHPDEGSMLAYSDALNHFKIENAAVRIEQKDLITLPTPFIAFSQIHGGTFSVVKNLTDNTSPIIQKIIEIHKIVEHMGMVQEAKFELEHQAYFECDSSGYLIKANDAFYRTLDLGKESAYGNQWMGFINSAMQDKFIEKWERLVNHGLEINEVVNGSKGIKYYITARRKPANTDQARVILGSISMAA